MPAAGRRAMNIDFAGRTAIVTGAGHGFGRAIAARLRRAPARGRLGLRHQRRRARRDRAPRQPAPAMSRTVDVTDRGGGPGRRRRGRGRRRSRRHPRQQCRRRARSGRPAARGDLARPTGRRSSPSISPAPSTAPGGGAGHEAPPRWAHRQHLERRRARRSASPASRPMPAPRPARSASPASSRTSSGPGTSPSTTSRRASCAPTRRPSGNGKRWAPRGRRRLVEGIALKRLGSARRHRPGGSVLRLRLRRLDHRPGAQRGRRQVTDERRGASRRRASTPMSTSCEDFCRIPSVSADPAYAAGIAAAAAWLAARLRRAGLEHVEMLPTGGHPAIFARLAEGPGRADHPGLRPLRRAAARPAGAHGRRRPSSPRCATTASMRAASPTTRARC